jgi:hypothetical protein
MPVGQRCNRSGRLDARRSTSHEGQAHRDSASIEHGRYIAPTSRKHQHNLRAAAFKTTISDGDPTISTGVVIAWSLPTVIGELPLAERALG